MYFIVFLAAIALAGLAGTAVAWRMAKIRLKRQLASAEARWQQQHQKDNPGSVMESFTMGWLNLLLQALWTPVLEKHVAGLTAELLQRVFNEVLQKNSQKAPWKFLESITIEELSFGLVPPSFQGALAKYDPTAALLNISMDARFNSSSAQAVMLVRTKGVGGLLAPLPVRLEATYVQFSGRLNLGLLLGPEPPGIKGIFYSFASPPALEIAVRPLGTPLPPEFDLGLASALQGVLRRIISRRMVEPHKRFFDLNRMYLNKHIARVGGPGGLLHLTVLCARHLAPTAADAETGTDKDKPPAQQQQQQQEQQQQRGQVPAVLSAAEEARSGRSTRRVSASKVPKCSSYCQVKYGQQVLRTPVTHHAAADDATWNWQLSLAVPAELTAGAAAADMLSLAVYDAQTVGDPALLGKCRVSLSSLQLVPNSEPRTLTLPLKGAASKHAALQLTLAWLKSTKRQQQGGAQTASPQQQQQPQQRQGQRQSGVDEKVPITPGSASPFAGSSGGGTTSSTPVPAAAAAVTAAQRLSHAAPGKSVTWHDERFRRLMELQLPVESTAAAQQAGPQQLLADGTRRRVSRSLGASPVGESFQPSLSGSSHRRAATLDSANLSSAAAAAAAAIAMPSAAATGKAAYSPASSSAASLVVTPHPTWRASDGATTDAPAGVAALILPAAPAAGPDASSTASRTPAAAGLGPNSDAAVSRSLLLGQGQQQPQGGKQRGSQSDQQQDQQAASSWLWPSRSSWSSWLGLAGSSSMHPAGVPADAAAAGGAVASAGMFDFQVTGGAPAAAASAGSVVVRATSPLALLTSAAQMQQQMQQQQQHLLELQKQLASVTSSYQQLQQQLRRDAHSALLQGGCFILHCQDGSTRPVLMYLTCDPAAAVQHSSCSTARSSLHDSSGGGSSAAASEWQQPVTGTGVSTHLADKSNNGNAPGAKIGSNKQGYGQQIQEQASTWCLVIAALPDGGKDGRRRASLAGLSAIAAKLSGGSSRQQQAAGQGATAAAGSSLAADAGADSSSGGGSSRRLARRDRASLADAAYESGGIPRSSLTRLHTIQQSAFAGAEAGIEQHAPAAAAAAVSTACLTVLLREEGGLVKLLLQLPPVGNGRSMNEWLFALKCLKDGRNGAAS